jgi:pyruvate dehydrogenase E2 component (dihydrolipoamide acetyltransferase)
MGVRLPHQVLVPPLGQTVDMVTLVTWYKHEGDIVREGDPLFAIETDKATLDVEAQASGVLHQVTALEGEQVRSLSVIALIVGADEKGPDGKTAGRDETMERDALVSAPATGSISFHVDPRYASVRERVFISPRARRLAEAEGVQWQELSGTGPDGAIVERDVRAHLEKEARRTITPVAERMANEFGLDWRRLQGSGPSGRVTKKDVAAAAGSLPAIRQIKAPTDEGRAEHPFNEPSTESLLQGVRAIIAQRMAQSASETARVTLMAEADASALVSLREQLSLDGFVASYNDLFLYLLGRTLREHPALNASLEEGVVRQWKRVHIGLAVDTDRGLLVPVLRDVDQKRLADLSQETGDLIARARANKLKPDELTGGTFTLTNLGMYGIDAFTPIVNLPETAILGVGRIKARPVAEEGKVVVRPVVWLSLTFDHRVVDGAPAARFMQRVVQLVERPHLMHT